MLYQWREEEEEDEEKKDVETTRGEKIPRRTFLIQISSSLKGSKGWRRGGPRAEEGGDEAEEVFHLTFPEEKMGPALSVWGWARVCLES